MLFIERNLDRQRNWPAALLATSTHDTKRSEDVRARIVAISEVPELWRRSLQHWHTANRRWKRSVNDLEAPDANEEYLLYQTLLGTWPVQANGEPQGAATPEYVERIQAYMAKALHEAKINTSWIQPNEEWDAAMRDFVAKILDDSPRNKFRSIFFRLRRRLRGLEQSIRSRKLCSSSHRPACRTFTRGTRSGTTAWSILTTGVR